MVAADGPAITGMFLLAWAIFSSYMLLAALRTDKATIVIFALLNVVFRDGGPAGQSSPSFDAS